MRIGLIGLGRMGSRIAEKLLRDGVEVIVWNRSPNISEEFKSIMAEQKLDFNLVVADSIANLVERLPKPAIVWIMLPADAVDEVLYEVKKGIKKGDLVIDGGNSYFKDTERRYKEFSNIGINYLGIGTSGGVLAVTNGYPFMVGGSRQGYEMIKPFLDSLSKPNGGHDYFGIGGAGHFVKMVHNGIEYGLMQSLGEGFDVLENSDYEFDLPGIAKLWQKGTLVSGFMLDRAVDALSKNPKLDDIVGVIDESGEAQWTIEAAEEEGVDADIIKRSLEYRRRSKNDEKIQKSFTARLVAALRGEFGGHDVKKKD